MALCIKNPTAVRLTHDLAAGTNETLTQAVIHALEDRLRKCRGRRTAPGVHDRIMRISERCRRLPDLDDRPADDILGYDCNGVPGHGH